MLGGITGRLVVRRALLRLRHLQQQHEVELRTVTMGRLQQEVEENKIRRSALMEGQDKEGRRISRELHDGVGQMLTAINLKITELVSNEEDSQVLKAMVEDTTNEIRRISQNLMPPVLVDFGLEAALRMLAKNSLKHAGIIVELDYHLPDGLRYPQQLEVAIYRIVQEAINNVMKHAQTREMNLLLEEVPEGLHLVIKDEGRGMDTETPPVQTEARGLGLQNMRERAELLGGTFRILSTPNLGTALEAFIPHHHAED